MFQPYDLNGDEVELPLTEVTWDAQAAEKGGYQHFMLKEIHEQPAAVRDTLNSLLKDGWIDLSGAGLTEEVLQSVSSIHIAACGSAWHVGVAAQYVLEELAEEASIPPEQHEVLEAVLALPVKYKDAIYLHYYEGYSAGEIGRILGKKENTVYSLLSRGRTMLKKALGGDL